MSLSYDDDFQADPRQALCTLLRAIGANADSVPELSSTVKASVSHPGRPGAPSPAEYDRMEAACDALLDRLGLAAAFGSVPLDDIRRKSIAAWEPFAAPAPAEASRLGALMFSRLRSRYLDTVQMMRRLGVNARNVEIALREAERRLREGEFAERETLQTVREGSR